MNSELQPIDANATRLIHRVRNESMGVIWDALDPGYFFMERAMVLGIKVRAEKLVTN